MDSKEKPSNYSPNLLDQEEKGTPTSVSQSIDNPSKYRDLRPKDTSYLEYPAKVADLRLVAPQAHALKTRLGDEVFVLQFGPGFSLDSVPGEWKKKDATFLWKVDVPGAKGYTTDSDLRTFYFPSEMVAKEFLRKMNEGVPEASFEETLEQRQNLKKLLW